MALILAQRFPLGRFHATRWNQNPFEDPHGEWPPSPWRLLRALAARWIQYSRETGNEEMEIRNGLLTILANRPPTFRLPELAWRAAPLRYYQPTEVTWTDASAKSAAYKKPKTTLVVDSYHALPPEKPLHWIWDDVDLPRDQLVLLRELLHRILYFGRAESCCRFQLLDQRPDELQPNCVLQRTRNGGTPVLVADPDGELDLNVLLAATDDKLIARRRIPPGSAWYYARIPARPSLRVRDAAASGFPENLNVVQFAVGGRVFPPISRWVKLTERFRGRVLRHRACQLTGNPKASYADLLELQRDQLALLSGKDGRGAPLEGHPHAYFLLWPDENGQPTRLLCFRPTPFTSDEVAALLAASEYPMAWESGSPDWRLRLVPLPLETPPPPGACPGESAFSVWRSATPFVLPSNRRRFRRNGRERPGESPERLLAKLLQKSDLPEAGRIEPLDESRSEWVYVHETRQERRRRGRERTPSVHPGYRFRITFPNPVRGPLCIGHSSHFGLGLFVPEET